VSAATTFYFVRHGESEANAARRFAGQSDSPLTAKGRRQADAVADELEKVPFDRVVSSDLSRTRDTAEVIAKRHGVPVEVVPALREIDVGEHTGKPFDEVAGLPEWRDDGFVTWPGGETLEQVLSRTSAPSTVSRARPREDDLRRRPRRGEPHPALALPRHPAEARPQPRDEHEHQRGRHRRHDAPGRAALRLRSHGLTAPGCSPGPGRRSR